MSPEALTRIGPYDVIGTIGAGRLGTVYRAYDEAGARVVIVRVLSPELLDDPPRREALRRNAQSLAALGHPNIAQTLGGGEDGGLVYTVMEYVDGGSLHDRLETSRLKLAEAIQVVREVASGLSAAHRLQILHGELTPRHVLVSRDLSAVKVADFNGRRPSAVDARVATVRLDRERLGSAAYRAPELSDAQRAADVRSDVYSLGVLAYQCLTGKLPWGKFRLPSDANPQVPLALDPILLKCLASDPNLRYESVAAFLADLDKVAEVVDYRLLSELKRLSRGRLFARRRASRRGARHSSRMPLYVGAGLIVLVAVALTAALALRRGARVSIPADVQRSAISPAQPEPGPASARPGDTRLESPSADSPRRASAAPSATGSGAAPPPTGGLPAATSPTVVPSSPAVASAPPSEPMPSDLSTPVARGPVTSAPGKAAAPEPASPGAGRSPANVPAPDPEASAEALFEEAQSLRRRGETAAARARLASIGRSYAHTGFFVPAMTAKIAIEDSERLQEFDPVVGAIVPASLSTRRLLTERAPRHPSAEATLWELGNEYEDVHRYPLAFKAYVQLGTTFPRTRFDAWYRAGEISERHLRDKERARQAYLNVPVASPLYEEAQKRARRLGR